MSTAPIILVGVNLIVMIIIFIIFLGRIRQQMRDKKAGLVIKDERSKYNDGRAAYYALHIGLYLMLGMMWYAFIADGLELPELETMPALILPLLIMSFALIGLRWHLGRSSDAL